MDRTIRIISATRLSCEDFWQSSALGQSLLALDTDGFELLPEITCDNSLGLPLVYNRAIEAAAVDDLLVFIHDDVWIDEPGFCLLVAEAADRFDIAGVAGCQTAEDRQPAWLCRDTTFERLPENSLSGAIRHGENAGGVPVEFGPVPRKCELLDGVCLITRKAVLEASELRFDPQFSFDFYDQDFCRAARKRDLTLGTWAIALTHQSRGDFGSLRWCESYRDYLQKWCSRPDRLGVVDSAYVAEPLLQLAINNQLLARSEMAAALYAMVLALQPDNSDANHNLGIIESQTVGALNALPRFERAVTQHPECEEYWVSYIDTLMKCGAVDVANSALDYARKNILSESTVQMLLGCHTPDSMFSVKSLVCNHLSKPH